MLNRVSGAWAAPGGRGPQSGALHSLAGPVAAVGVGVVDGGAHVGGVRC